MRPGSSGQEVMPCQEKTQRKDECKIIEVHSVHYNISN